MKQYFSLNNSQNGQTNERKNSNRSSQSVNQRKSVKFMQKIVTDAAEQDHFQQMKHNNKKIIDKIQSYHNSTDDDYYQKFGKMDMLNEEKRVHQEMIESEQEKKSNAIMRFISTINEKKKSIQGKTQQISEIQNQENVKQTETADDIVLILLNHTFTKTIQNIQKTKDYIDQQRQSIKQIEIDLKNSANMKKVKQKGFYSKELGFKSKPIEVFNRISKIYDKHEHEENQNIRQVAAESSLLFKIDQQYNEYNLNNNKVDSRYTREEEKRINQELVKEKRNKIVFYKKEFNQLNQGYLQPNKLYHQRRQMNSMTIQNLRNQEFEKNLFLVTNDFSQMRPSTSQSNMKGFSQYSSIMSKRSDSQIKQDTLNRKKLNAVLIAQQLNEKLIEQGVLKSNYDLLEQSKQQPIDSKSHQSSQSKMIQNNDNNNGNQQKNQDYYFGKKQENVNEGIQIKINVDSSNK